MPIFDAIFTLQTHLIIERAIVTQSTSLFLCDLNLKEIPLSVSRVNPQRLHLSRNRISRIPKELCNLEQLLSLALDYNRIQNLPSYFMDCQMLIKLNLNHNSLKVIPNEIFHLRNLEVLWLNHTDIDEIPPSIKYLTELETFGARGNLLTSLPDEFGELENLKWLTLQDNQLIDLPPRLKSAGLKHLNLSLNSIVEFPPCILELKELQFCFIASNKIRKLSNECFSSLSHLKLLDLHKNPLANDIDLKEFPFVTTLCQGGGDSSSSDSESSEDEEEDWADSVASSDLNTSDDEEDLDIVNRINNPGAGATVWVPLMSKITACAH